MGKFTKNNGEMQELFSKKKR